MPATPRYLSATNGFLPVATKQIVAYVRDPKKFRLNQYVQHVQSPAPTASYLKLDRDQPVRVVSDKAFAWQDGDKRPTGNHNLSNFAWQPFQTERRSYPFTLGNQAVKNAKALGGWDPVAYESKSVSSQAMVNRTNRVISMLETTSNWGTHYATADTLSGGRGYWDQSGGEETDANYNAIFESLMAAAETISKATNAVVSIEDLVLVLSPRAARKMAASGEIRNYMKGSVHSLPHLKGEISTNMNAQWGLPPVLYGVTVVVENTVRVTTHPYAGDSTGGTRVHVKSDSSALLLSRPGGLDAPFGAPSFSTVQCYWYTENGEDGGELDLEVREDSWHRMTEGSCVEQFAEVLAASPAGYLITDILSAGALA